MKGSVLTSEVYVKNRINFANQMVSGSLALFFSADEYPRNGDQYFPYRQNSDLIYLSGIEQEDSILIISPDANRAVLKEVLFIKKVNQTDILWNGKKLTIEQAKNISGIQTVYYLDQFKPILHELMCESHTVYLWQNEFPKFRTEVVYKSLRMSNEIRQLYPNHSYLRSFHLLEKLRLVKSEYELDLMQKAANITSLAFVKILQNTQPGKNEMELEAEITYEFLKNGARSHAYQPIIASGENACILHYTENNSVCKSGELLLIDFGAEYKNYAADCTRTIPVNGKFTPRQAKLYQVVLNVFNMLKAEFIPGNSINNINELAIKLMNEELIKLGFYSHKEAEESKDNPLYMKYFPHGASHFIGLDVHDVGAKNEPFKKGMVLTCEPGLYIEDEKIGIRIETDLIVGEPPIDLFENMPIEVYQIETAMKKRQKI